MPTFWKQWLLLSVALTSGIYLTIIMVFGHDPAPVTEIFYFSSWGHNGQLFAIVDKLAYPYPKFSELLLGPCAALIYLHFIARYVWWSERFVKLTGMYVLSHIIIADNVVIGTLAFFVVGHFIGRGRRGNSYWYTGTLCLYSLLTTLVLASHGPGLIIWGLLSTTTFIGHSIGQIYRERKQSRR